MKICIGIVSYLPDDINKRPIRYNKCQDLITQCNKIFNIPIIIICQNYRDLKLYGDNLIIYQYKEKLGIVEARRILRKKFLESDFDYIMLNDDDISIIGTFLEGQEFLKYLVEEPNTCFVQNRALFSGLCISKTLFAKVDIPDLEASKGEGYEDLAFYKILEYLCNRTPRKVPTSIVFQHNFQYSTWACRDLMEQYSKMRVATLEWVDKKIEEYKQQNNKE